MGLAEDLKLLLTTDTGKSRATTKQHSNGLDLTRSSRPRHSFTMNFSPYTETNRNPGWSISIPV